MGSSVAPGDACVSHFQFAISTISTRAAPRTTSPPAFVCAKPLAVARPPSSRTDRAAWPALPSHPLVDATQPESFLLPSVPGHWVDQGALPALRRSSSDTGAPWQPTDPISPRILYRHPAPDRHT